MHTTIIPEILLPIASILTQYLQPLLSWASQYMLQQLISQQQQHPLVRLKELLDFTALEVACADDHKMGKGRGRPVTYTVPQLLRLLFLRYWHNLSLRRSEEDIDDETARTLRRAYYACVSYADAQVGKLLDELDVLRLRENTIVVLWGDHGYKLGDYGSWCKWSNMNLDTNIPLIFSVPDGIEGGVCNQTVEALDIYPTLVDLCKLKQPDHLEGKSLKPLLGNPALKTDATKYAYTIWPEQRWSYERTVMGYSVKSERFNYVEWVKLSTGEVVGRELYDHSNDPKETKNVIGNSGYSSVVKKLAKQCQIRKSATHHDHAFRKIR